MAKKKHDAALIAVVGITTVAIIALATRKRTDALVVTTQDTSNYSQITTVTPTVENAPIEIYEEVNVIPATPVIPPPVAPIPTDQGLADSQALANVVSGQTVSPTSTGGTATFINTSDPIYAQVAVTSPVQAVVTLPDGTTMSFGSNMVDPVYESSVAYAQLVNLNPGDVMYNHYLATLIVAQSMI